MSYIKVKFPDGVERGLKFNQLAINTLLTTADLSDWNATANYAMVWGGLRGNAFVKREELGLDFEQVCDFVELMSSEDLASIDKALQESIAYQKAIEAATDAAKLTKKKPLSKRKVSAK